jgi:xylan 1,4-beta-xylosidase
MKAPGSALIMLALVLWCTRGGAQTQPLQFDPAALTSVSLPADSPIGEASIREHAVAWHPAKGKYYLVADVVPLGSPHHPNTYETELYLWSSPDLKAWSFIGLAVPKGEPATDYDGHGAASPAGMAFLNGKLYVPFSARKTARFTQRGVGLAWSSKNPEDLPWHKTALPVSDLPGEDDDPAALAIPGDDALHLYHRTTGEGGYRIVHTSSRTPEDPSSWARAADVTARPEGVRAQELTGAIYWHGRVHLFVIEQGPGVKGIQIAHLMANEPGGMFREARPGQRYIKGQPSRLAYGGHFTPVMYDGELTAAFWTVPQAGARYGLEGRCVGMEER